LRSTLSQDLALLSTENERAMMSNAAKVYKKTIHVCKEKASETVGLMPGPSFPYS